MVKRLIISILTLSVATNAQAYMEDFCLPSFYLGADAQLRHMPFKKNFGGNIYKRDYPQGNIYIGVKGNEYIGLETGYEFSRTGTRNVSLSSGESLLGIVQPFDVKEKIIIRFRGLHASIIGFLPVCYVENLKILTGIGILNLKVKTKTIVTEVAGTPVSGTPLHLTESKYLLRFMIGLQYMLNDSFGLRANVRWENTRKLANIVPVRSDSTAIAKAKNSIVAGLGAIVEF